MQGLTVTECAPAMVHTTLQEGKLNSTGMVVIVARVLALSAFTSLRWHIMFSILQCTYFQLIHYVILIIMYTSKHLMSASVL